mmetsp:Transcript_120357/g.347871  ORF Transcript_120357/g.347871 Transcript_120357/m.347871 type:complete len:223 (-) Transcript_120357:1024-1692(-)
MTSSGNGAVCTLRKPFLLPGFASSSPNSMKVFFTMKSVGPHCRSAVTPAAGASEMVKLVAAKLPSTLSVASSASSSSKVPKCVLAPPPSSFAPPAQLRRPLVGVSWCRFPVSAAGGGSISTSRPPVFPFSGIAANPEGSVLLPPSPMTSAMARPSEPILHNGPVCKSASTAGSGAHNKGTSCPELRIVSGSPAAGAADCDPLSTAGAESIKFPNVFSTRCCG